MPMPFGKVHDDDDSVCHLKRSKHCLKKNKTKTPLIVAQVVVTVDVQVKSNIRLVFHSSISQKSLMVI